MNCPVCGTSAPDIAIENNFDAVGKAEYKLFECSLCGCQFCDPFKNPGAEWYSKSSFYTEAENPVTKAFPGRLKPFFKLGLDKNLEILDVGCGSGVFVNAAIQRGYKCDGIDFSCEELNKARSIFGLNTVYKISLDELMSKEGGKKYGIITLFGILEHSDNPKELIRKSFELLDKNGYICVNVPNRKRPLFFGNREQWDYPPHHLTRWGVDSLSYLLEKSGFKIVKVYDSSVPVIHVYNQLFGIFLDNLIRASIKAVKKVLFKEYKGEEVPITAMFEKTEAGFSSALLRPAFIRRMPVYFVKYLSIAVFLPITLPLALFYNLMKRRGCELFVAAVKTTGEGK